MLGRTRFDRARFDRGTAPLTPSPALGSPLALILATRRRRRAASPGPGPTAASLLEAIVQYLLATPSVASLLYDASSIRLDLSNEGQGMPFLVVEGYDELSPGPAVEDEPVELSISIYAGDVATVRAIINAVAAAVDSPNINPASTRTEQFSWAGGTTTGVMRDRTLLSRTPGMTRGGELCYQGRVDYQIWITPGA